MVKIDSIHNVPNVCAANGVFDDPISVIFLLHFILILHIKHYFNIIIVMFLGMYEHVKEEEELSRYTSHNSHVRLTPYLSLDYKHSSLLYYHVAIYHHFNFLRR